MTSAALPANPFPGMNPYLENPGLWPDVHNSIIVGLRDFLAPRLQPEYVVRMQQRVYVTRAPGPEGGLPPSYRIPDAVVLTETAAAPGRTIPTPAPGTTSEPGPVPVPGLAPETASRAVAVRMPSVELEKEHYLEVLRVGAREVVAVIELLSPANKWGDGRQEYLAKRAAVKISTAHLVEIDLLRSGAPMPVIGDAPAGMYRILVRDARRSPMADLYVFGIRDAIPDFALPLSAGAEGVGVSLNQVVKGVYTAGAYYLDIDYGCDPEPPLSDADRVWVDGLLREQGLRQ